MLDLATNVKGLQPDLLCSVPVDQFQPSVQFSGPKATVA